MLIKRVGFFNDIKMINLNCKYSYHFFSYFGGALFCMCGLILLLLPLSIST